MSPVPISWSRAKQVGTPIRPAPAASGGTTASTGPPASTHGATSTKAVLGKPFARLADWLGRMLGLWGIVYLLCAVVPAWFWMNPPRLDVAAQPTTTTTTGVGAAENVEGVAALVWAGLGLGTLSLITVVTWLDPARQHR